MVGSPHTQCPKRATQGPQGTKPESRVTRLGPVGGQRHCHRGGLLWPVCRGRAAASRLAAVGEDHGRQRPWGAGVWR